MYSSAFDITAAVRRRIKQGLYRGFDHAIGRHVAHRSHPTPTTKTSTTITTLRPLKHLCPPFDISSKSSHLMSDPSASVQIQGSSSPPPKGIPSSPSIFAYQTRLLTRTSSSTTSLARNLGSPPSAPASSNLAGMAGGQSPPSTPIRRNVARMIADGNGLANGKEVGLGLGMGMGLGHRPKGRSVDLVRGWEAKINQSNDGSPVKPGAKQTTMPPPPIPNTEPSYSSDPFIAKSPPAMNGDSTSDPVFTTPKATKRATVSGMDSFDKVPSESDRSSSSASRVRPASISSHASLLTPHSTGDSSVISARSQATEDRIAKAKANALKRREAKAAAAGVEPTLKAVSPSTVSTSINSTPTKSSPFSQLFEPPTAEDKSTPKRPITSTSKSSSSRLSAREVFETSLPDATSVSSVAPSAPKYIPSGLSLGQPPSSTSGLAPAPGPSKDKYGSISKTDRRRLGRHLPRIASGGEGWEDEGGPSTGRTASGHPRVPSTLGRQAEAKDVPASPTKPSFTSTSAPSRPRATEVLAPSSAPNVPPVSPVSAPASSVHKRRSAYLSQIGKPELPTGVGINAPRPEVAGADMKGLMKDVGSMSNRTVSRDAEGVTGMSSVPHANATVAHRSCCYRPV